VESAPSIEELRGLLRHLFPAANTATDHLVYVDEEGDEIRITHDIELREAVTSAPERNGSKILKLFVKNPSKATPVPVASTQTQQQPQQTQQQPLNLFDKSLFSADLFLPALLGGDVQSLVNSLSNLSSGVAASPIIKEAMRVFAQNLSSLPPDQIVPMLLNLLQNPMIQQLVPQIMSSLLAGNRPSSPNAQVNVATNTTPSPMVDSSTSTRAPSFNSSSTNTVPIPVPAMVDNATSTNTAYATIATNTAVAPVMVDSSTLAKPTSATVSTMVSTVEDVSDVDGNALPPPGNPFVPVAPSSPLVQSLAGTKFVTMLEQLKELGFDEEQKNIHLIVKHGGNMVQVVDELLGGQ